MLFKQPVSILVVIYAQDSKRVLMLQRRDDPSSGSRLPAAWKRGKPRRRPPCVK